MSSFHSPLAASLVYSLLYVRLSFEFRKSLFKLFKNSFAF
jgi:hypothetical protein